jgi:hypothetical protein
MLTDSRINQIYVAEQLTKSYYGEYAYFGLDLLKRINEDYSDVKITVEEWTEYTEHINYWMDEEYKLKMEFAYGNIDSSYYACSNLIDS